MDFAFLDNLNLDADLILSVVIIIVTILTFFLMRFGQLSLLSKKGKEKSGCKIADILSKETFQKTKKFFDLYLEIPVIIIILIILFVIPAILPFDLSFEILFATFLIVIILYLTFFPQFFKIIERKNLVKLDQYLSNLNEEAVNTIEIFNYIWKIKDDDIKKNFLISPVLIFQIFSQKIDKLFLSDKTTTILIYLNNFLDSIDNRLETTLTDEKIFSKTLDWHFIIWEKKYKKSWLDNDNLSFRENDEELFTTIEFIIKRIENSFLTGKKSLFLFKIFKKHLEKNEEVFFNSINQEINYYVKPLFSHFLKELFIITPNLSIKEQEDIWKYYFPKEWKVTTENLEDDNNLISKISFNCFLDWAQEKILEDKEIDIDKELDLISKYLFPEVDSIIWDRLLTFVLCPYSSKNKVKSAIERPWNFGFSREKYVDYYQDQNKESFLRVRNEKINKTIELAFFLFTSHFSNKKLESYINKLKKLTYKSQSKEENKRYQLLTIFKRMLKYSLRAQDLSPKISKNITPKFKSLPLPIVFEKISSPERSLLSSFPKLEKISLLPKKTSSISKIKTIIKIILKSFLSLVLSSKKRKPKNF